MPHGRRVSLTPELWHRRERGPVSPEVSFQAKLDANDRTRGTGVPPGVLLSFHAMAV